MTEVLNQSVNMRPISAKTSNSEMLKDEKYLWRNNNQQTKVSTIIDGTHLSKVNSLKIDNLDSSKSNSKSKKKIPSKKTIKEYNSISEIPIDERTALYSNWTPLSDEIANKKFFDERKLLMMKWFESWNDKQRKIAIDDIFGLCKTRQLTYAKETLNRIAPTYHLDFTRMFPRVLTMYIFSSLDAKSLSQCAQVCWYWKTLSELDQLWIPLCLKLNWVMDYAPSPHEVGVWKRFYIQNIKILKALQKKEVPRFPSPLSSERSEIDDHKKQPNNFFIKSFYRHKFRTMNTGSVPVPIEKRPPWRANCFNPNQLYRFNYLENEKDAMEKRANHLIKTLSLDSSSKLINKTNNLRKTNPDKTTNSKSLNGNESSIASRSSIQNQMSVKKPLSATSLNSQKHNETSSIMKSNSSTFSGNESKKLAWKLIEESDEDTFK